MFDTAPETGSHLTHDRPCPQCGHAMHTYLACSDTCSCQPVGLRTPALAYA